MCGPVSLQTRSKRGRCSGGSVASWLGIHGISEANIGLTDMKSCQRYSANRVWSGTEAMVEVMPGSARIVRLGISQ